LCSVGVSVGYSGSFYKPEAEISGFFPSPKVNIGSLNSHGINAGIVVKPFICDVLAAQKGAEKANEKLMAEIMERMILLQMEPPVEASPEVEPSIEILEIQQESEAIK